MGAERGAGGEEGRIEENREERGQKRKEGGIMNAFCVKAALSVVGRAPGRRLRALREGGAEEGQRAENRSAFDLVSSRVHRRWMARARGRREM